MPTIVVNGVAHDIALEFILQINDVKRESELDGDRPRVVQIIQRAATAGQRFAVRPNVDAALIPELHRKAYQFVPLLFE